MGLGKTSTTLVAIKRLMDAGEVHHVLIVAPLRVAGTVWAEEADKWGMGLSCAKILGTEAQRRAAIDTDADIHIINRENVAWLVKNAWRKKYWDMLVIDELSSFKSCTSIRFKALKAARKVFKRIVGLTGTPAPNGLMDLWAEVYLLDGGDRLGPTIGGYRQRYFSEGQRSGSIVYNWVPKKGAQEAVYKAIGDICMSMTAQDYLHMPKRIDITVNAHMDAEEAYMYMRMKESLVLPYRDTQITASNAAVLSNKLLQMANGAVYNEEGDPCTIHTGKTSVLIDLIDEANGQPVLIYYAYGHDRDAILRSVKARVLESVDDIAAWNRGEVPVMLAHPASAGHGLNLQQGGHIVIWYGLTWSLELYQQANARLYRQGQTHPVTIYHIVTEGTIDTRVMDALRGKADAQQALIDAVKKEVDG